MSARADTDCDGAGQAQPYWCRAEDAPAEAACAMPMAIIVDDRLDVGCSGLAGMAYVASFMLCLFAELTRHVAVLSLCNELR